MVEIIDRKGAREYVEKAFKALAAKSMEYSWKKGSYGGSLQKTGIRKRTLADAHPLKLNEFCLNVYDSSDLGIAFKQDIENIGKELEKKFGLKVYLIIS
jgi:hypothetical protein